MSDRSARIPNKPTVPIFPAVRIYPITDVQLTGLSHAEQVERLIQGGATLIQLREKRLPPNEFFKQADEAVKMAHARGVQIIINDRVDIALAVKADGVHLGQDDMPPAAARALLGDHALIGYSTHSVQQAVGALNQPVDYVAIGPIFPTTSKRDTEPLVGLTGLQQVRAATGEIPLVAIGGITAQNMPGVFHAGADCVAVIQAALKDPTTIVTTTAHLLDLA